VLYRPAGTNDAWYAIRFQVTNREPLRLLLNLTTSYDFGRYQVRLNGVTLGEPLDLYSATTSSREFHLLDFWPEPGGYELRLECVGRSHASQGYYLGIESVRLRERRPRVAEYGHDRAKDWRAQRLLYE
jgi:hypothetical protein